MTILDPFASVYVDRHRPWPRAMVDASGWRDLSAQLAAGKLTLLGLWGDRDDREGNTVVHMALLDETTAACAVASHVCADGRFPSVAAVHLPAARLERTIVDLHGLQAEGASDRRPWLDFGLWHIAAPLGSGPARTPTPIAYDFLGAEGEALHQVPVGPVHAGIIEPGHFRFTANGETVVRLEERLGYVHKGVDGLMRGTNPTQATRLAGRVSGDSTVAYALAFARAVEQALALAVPSRGQWLRGVMAELERLANHFGDIGAICNDAAFALLQAHFSVLREETLRAADRVFGHRLMRDAIMPGGVTMDIPATGLATLRDHVALVHARFPVLVTLYDETASLQDRTVSTGILKPELAQRFGAGGYVGRGSGRAFDARKMLPYPPYDQLRFEVPVFSAGDVNARVWVRIREIEQSLALLEQMLDRLPDGAVMSTDTHAGSGEGLALVEAFRGDVMAWVRIEDGKVARGVLRDASWFQWPLLEAVIENNIIADFPLCNKSFNCSYSGHDL